MRSASRSRSLANASAAAMRVPKARLALRPATLASSCWTSAGPRLRRRRLGASCWPRRDWRGFGSLTVRLPTVRSAGRSCASGRAGGGPPLARPRRRASLSSLRRADRPRRGRSRRRAWAAPRGRGAAPHSVRCPGRGNRSAIPCGVRPVRRRCHRRGSNSRTRCAWPHRFRSASGRRLRRVSSLPIPCAWRHPSRSASGHRIRCVSSRRSPLGSSRRPARTGTTAGPAHAAAGAPAALGRRAALAAAAGASFVVCHGRPIVGGVWSAKTPPPLRCNTSRRRGRLRNPGDDLLSQGVPPQVPSALAVFTAVFGMGTGVSPPQ